MADILSIKVDLSGWAGGPGVNTFNFVNGLEPGNWNDGDANEAADMVHSFYNTIDTYLTNECVATIPREATVYDSTTGVPVAVRSLTARAPVPGIDSADSVPRYTCIVSKLRTDKTVGRHILTGRHFLGPTGIQAFTNTGGLTAGALAVVPTAYAGMLDVAGPRLIVWHRPVKGAGGDWAHIQTAVAKSLPGVLRSRRD